MPDTLSASAHARGTRGAALVGSPSVDPRISALLDARTRTVESFFAAEAARIARLCHRMAERFVRGGRLIALGDTPAARSDARHVAVEFVHPVIVGKRALPAIALTAEGGSLAQQTALLVRPDDIVIGFSDAPPSSNATKPTSIGDASAAMRTARSRGCLTIAFASQFAAEWTFVPPTGDPFVQQEVIETLYHVLWESVHVFFEQRGLLVERGDTNAADVGVHDTGVHDTGVHDAGASSFLYPFLAQQEHDLEAVLADVQHSIVLKAQDVTALRIQTIDKGDADVAAAATLLRSAFDSDRTALVFGNGGSATDAMDAVADLRFPPPELSSLAPRPALDLTEDTAILTAIANDIGADALFARQIIAYGRSGDVVLTFSTSGNSRNVIQALDEARRRGFATVALVGYDGGRVRSEQLADVVIVSPSQYVPRVQEAQATVWHIIRTLVG